VGVGVGVGSTSSNLFVNHKPAEDMGHQLVMPIGKCKYWSKSEAVRSNIEPKLLSFGHDVLWDRVVSLQKRAMVGNNWIFIDIP